MTTLEQAVGVKLAAAIEQGDQRQAEARAALGIPETNLRPHFGLSRRPTTDQGEGPK
ncbi:hypothetical protein [Micromonospora tulbaghiae]|uniref:hypothetical protein n=1 Tax=Micromonospora tulbaghiae TaxID=479978 RepID=UPI003EB699E7